MTSCGQAVDVYSAGDLALSPASGFHTLLIAGLVQTGTKHPSMQPRDSFVAMVQPPTNIALVSKDGFMTLGNVSLRRSV